MDGMLPTARQLLIHTTPHHTTHCLVCRLPNADTNAAPPSPQRQHVEPSALPIVTFSRATPLDLTSANANIVAAVRVGKKNKLELLTYEKNGMKRREGKVLPDYVAGQAADYCDEVFEEPHAPLAQETEEGFEVVDLRFSPDGSIILLTTTCVSSRGEER